MTVSQLHQIPIDKIERNPENPRLVFRSKEFDELTESIRKYGVQVPISLYKEGKKYVLIDGERRWKASLKLNRPTIPALIQDKPNSLTNLLLMFNIHALREQWDLLTIAMKLPRVISLLRKETDREPTERQISEHTGMPRATIRRCRMLMELPEKYRDVILQELRKPKRAQKLTEDFFIEMERALTTAQRAMPEVVGDRDKIRQVLIAKYKSNIIGNRVDFRKIAKIARAARVGADVVSARKALYRLFESNQYSIDAAFQASVANSYSERDLGTRIQGILYQLEFFEDKAPDDEIRDLLGQLVAGVEKVLRKRG